MIFRQCAKHARFVKMMLMGHRSPIIINAATTMPPASRRSAAGHDSSTRLASQTGRGPAAAAVGAPQAARLLLRANNEYRRAPRPHRRRRFGAFTRFQVKTRDSSNAGRRYRFTLAISAEDTICSRKIPCTSRLHRVDGRACFPSPAPRARCAP